MIAALANLSGQGHYIDWGWLHISVANALVIGLLVITFVAAVALPFPKGKE
ncbi:MAG: hypothetical protein NT160_02325 [Actinobacteria bacterium]|jgi:hypothetical protein|nr:hypothetical protein [Actinomycetota bacterium]